MPLLVSVRSGARDSMPGMMDTILNLGLNDETAEGPRRGDRQPALRLRLPTAASSRCMATSCMGVQKRHENEHDPFEAAIEALKHELGVHDDTDLDRRTPARARSSAIMAARQGAYRASRFPQDPYEQLEGADRRGVRSAG